MSETKRQSIARIVLWLFVVNLGLTIGGGLYETVVVMPLWAVNPPDSVLAYYHHSVVHPQFVAEQGRRFWMFVTPMLGLISIATLVTGPMTTGSHRRWRMTGAALTLVVVAFTFAWFVPKILLLMGEEVTRLDPVQITSLTNWWVGLNWVRTALCVGAWLAGLRALTLPSNRDGAAL